MCGIMWYKIQDDDDVKNHNTRQPTGEFTRVKRFPTDRFNNRLAFDAMLPNLSGGQQEFVCS